MITTLRALRVSVAGPAWALALGLAAAGCQGRAGAACQAQSDCHVGFICDKPALSADAGPRPAAVFGVCQPARLGLGGICLVSGDCQDGLGCSNTVGKFNTDGWHGTCEVLPSSGDAGADLSDPGDLAIPRDE